jgi:hypothetical protein
MPSKVFVVHNISGTKAFPEHCDDSCIGEKARFESRADQEKESRII